jgi:hypothetical protein
MLPVELDALPHIPSGLMQQMAFRRPDEFSGLRAYFDGSTPAYDRTRKLDAAFTSMQQ